MKEFILENWFPILLGILALAEIIVRLTPTKKDDTILSYIIKILKAVFPNRDIKGGDHGKV